MGELKLEMRMTQQILWVYPAVEDVRQQLFQKLFAWEAIATSHPRIQSSRYQHQVSRRLSIEYMAHHHFMQSDWKTYVVCV